MPFVDLSLYVMTPEFGAASQLEKIDMLDFADAWRSTSSSAAAPRTPAATSARQLVRNREAFGKSWEDMPVFGTSAATFNDDGVTALYQHLRDELAGRGLPVPTGVLPAVDGQGLHRPPPPSCPRPGRATCPTSPTPSAATTGETEDAGRGASASARTAPRRSEALAAAGRPLRTSTSC